MRPYLFELPGYPVSSYFLLYGLGLLAGCISFEVLCRRRGVPGGTAALVASLICLSVPVGARAYYVAQNWGRFSIEGTPIFSIREGGQVFYGWLILGGIVAVFLVHIRRPHRPTMLDALGVATPLGYSFGRIGCFLSGCCWGNLWDGSLAVRFPRQLAATGALVGSPAFKAHHEAGLVPFPAKESLPVYPVQLLAAAVSLSIFGLMLWLYWNRRLEGQLAPLYLMIYAVTRWFIEIIRINPRTYGMSAAQWTSIVVFIVGAVWFLRSRATKVLAPVKQ